MSYSSFSLVYLPLCPCTRLFQPGRGSLRRALKRAARRGSTPCWPRRQESSISSSWSTRWTTPPSTGASRGADSHLVVTHISTRLLRFYTSGSSGSLDVRTTHQCVVVRGVDIRVCCCPAGMKSVRRSWCPFWRRWDSTPRRTSTSCRARASQVPTSRSPSPNAPGTCKSARCLCLLLSRCDFFLLL